MKTKAAGFSTVLPNQNAVAAAADAPRWRSPMTTGAAQQVHIIPGIANNPPIATLRKLAWPSILWIHALGANSCSAEPKRRPKTMACQIDFP